MSTHFNEVLCRGNIEMHPSFSQDCSLVMLNHGDIYSSMESPGLILPLEYLADVIIKAEPLATGLATDVHGQVLMSSLLNAKQILSFLFA